MNDTTLDTIVDSIASKSDLQSSDIPTLDLYMDQIMTLFENTLQDNKRHSENKILTKTMINNYSKVGLVQPVKGKKYTKEQILQMLLVYNLKNTITMQEIKQVLTPSYHNDTSIEELYQRFISIKEKQKQELKPLIESVIAPHALQITQEEDRILLLMALANLSNQLKETVEKIIDTYYPLNK